MCEPVTIGLMVASTLASARGAYVQSKAAQGQANYQAGVARNNATMAEYAAKDAIERGGEAANRSNQQYRQLRGRQVATMAANGIDIGEGSAQSILDDTDMLTSIDATTIRNNAARQAWGYQVEGQNYSSSAGMYKATADAENPMLSAGASLLGGAAQIGMAGQQMGYWGKKPAARVG